tara:strand:+ start:5745 stop:6161 length:417 start_codon:yes stop_codon:yes gene_type:complete
MPVNRRSINVLGSTGTNMNETSNVVKGDSFYGYSDGWHTFQVVFNQFVGRLHVEASLANTPTDSDWFSLKPEVTAGTEWSANTSFIQFNSNNPADGSEAYTFRGNFTYLRVRMDRAHVGDGETYDTSYGSISKVILSA